MWLNPRIQFWSHKFDFGIAKVEFFHFLQCTICRCTVCDTNSTFLSLAYQSVGTPNLVIVTATASST